ncbi:MAG: hypothetical protein IJW63_01795 [Lachnospiraceae bacterium]|nr:hypothetical protein [Lachnospiraceae bacterium]
MAYDDSVTVSFRLNLNREEDMEIQRFLMEEARNPSYGGKSKFIKSVLIREIQGIKRENNDNRLVCEMNTQRTALQDAVSEEADRVIETMKLIVKDEVERLAGIQIEKKKQTESETTEPMSEGIKEPELCFGEVPESSGEDVSEDVMAFLEDL